MNSEFRRDSKAAIIRLWNRATPEQRTMIYTVIMLRINLARLGLVAWPKLRPDLPSCRPAVSLN